MKVQTSGTDSDEVFVGYTTKTPLQPSQRKQMQYATMLASLKLIYRIVVSKDLVLRFVMGDADEARFDAVPEHIIDELSI
ncbi:hypothetical protein PHMEG_00012588 [Phytophthora megakarya]|uniref:Uncharacterized protein n=1 Tax=Phytophthora megakarya TaxID=4795 RepID=A0A225W8T7_9STRA|nr:hypothetical protein PHMEG_00012588 [Phytophthora megakarya]